VPGIAGETATFDRNQAMHAARLDIIEPGPFYQPDDCCFVTA
jgi:hypothetical protein